MRAENHNLKINLLIIGTGMYVCGRGTDSYGAILPAVMQSYKLGHLDNVLIASKTRESFKDFDTKVHELRLLLGTDFPYTQYPTQKETDPTAYRSALQNLPQPGAVIIVTPDHLHTEMALAGIENGKHILIVKPLAPTVSEAYQLIQAAGNAGVYGAVEFHKRWDWANLKLLHALNRKVVGDPLYFHVEYSQRKSIPTQAFSSWINHTNIFQYLGVHYADIIHFVTHDTPTRLIAVGQKKYLTKRGISTYDSIQVLVEWSEGFVSTFLTNWIDPENNSAMSNQKIKIVGTKGRLESNQTARGIRLDTDSEGLEEVNPYFCQPYPDLNTGQIEYRGYGIDSIMQFLKDVLAITRGECSPGDFEGRRPTFRDALVSTAIVEAVNMSLEHDSGWVYFDDDVEPYMK
jgi:predicted dehydrogenase